MTSCVAILKKLIYSVANTATDLVPKYCCIVYVSIDIITIWLCS